MSENFFKTHRDGCNSIKILNNHEYCQEWLCSNPLFEKYREPKWNWDDRPKLSINDEEVELIFESAVESYIVFQSESLRDEVFQWLNENNYEDPNYWACSVKPVMDKLNSENIALVKEGFHDLRQWVEDYNSHYVDHMMGEADLTLIGYDFENFEEGNLWPNPLFDEILENHRNELEEDDLLNLIYALFNSNEEFMDCKATYTAINLLLENRTAEREISIVDAILNGLEGYEPGHRYFEQSLLDRLIDEILPEFSVDSIIYLLERVHPDNIREDGDNFISLAHCAMEKNTLEVQREKLKMIQEKD